MVVAGFSFSSLNACVRYVSADLHPFDAEDFARAIAGLDEETAVAAE